MKIDRKLSAALAASIAVTAVLGCSWSNPFSGSGNTNSTASTPTRPANISNTNANRSITDIAVDTAVGEQKLGIPECDEVMDMLTSYANNPDDNFAVRAAKGVFVGKIKQTIRQNLEENQTDKVELARVCREAKGELEKYKAQEAPKQN